MVNTVLTHGHQKNTVISGRTVEPLMSHTPRWIAQAMGYERLWVLRGQFGCKFQFGSGPNLLWGMSVSTVLLK